MIAKISCGNSLYGALSYNQEKVDKGEGKVLATNIVRQPVTGIFNITDCMHQFEEWMPSHYRTKNTVMHVSLNPHPDDKLTDTDLAAIGEEYMQKLGYGGQPYMIFKHEDIDRHHIHIVSLRVDSRGQKIDDSYEHRRSKKITRDIENKYGLHPAEGKDNPQEKWEFTPVDTNKGNLKHQISNVVKPLIDMYDFQSLGEYRALLSLYNITVEEVNGQAKGKPFHGLLYSALDKEGNKYGPPLKSSVLGKVTGYDSLSAVFKESAKKSKAPKARNDSAQLCIGIDIAASASLNEVEFLGNLKKQNVSVVFRRNDTGRIYGVTFIDHSTRTVYNGSRLGKGYSANVFNDWLNKGVRPAIAFTDHREEEGHDTVLPPLSRDGYGRDHSHRYSSPGDFTYDDQFRPYDNGPGTNYEHDSSGDMFSLFGPVGPSASDDLSAFRRKKKKKRRKPGRQQ